MATSRKKRTKSSTESSITSSSEPTVIWHGKHAGMYRIRPGVYLPRVTSILGVLDKPALRYWYAKEERKAILKTIEDYSSTHPYLSVGDLCEIIKRSPYAAQRKNERAVSIGSSVHRAIERYLKGDPGGPDGLSDNAYKIFDKWLRWWESERIKIIAVEKTVYDLKAGYAGTFDLYGEWKGKRVMFDWKTSSGLYPEYILQNAAYRKAGREKYPTDMGALVVIPKKGEGDLIIKTMVDYHHEYELFLCLLWVYKYLQTLKTPKGKR